MKSSYDINSAKKSTENEIPKVSTFRRILPQILASTIKNFLLLDLGLSVAFPTIVIPALTGFGNDKNQNEYLTLTKSQASWLGSVAYICQPVGSILSGWISEPLGRKKAMFLVNIPHVIAWIMMYNSTTVFEVFFANIMLGLGVGLMEAPIITYVGEICEPSIRGILITCAGIAATLGFFIIFLMGTLMDWRSAALYCLIIPILTMIAVCFIPETPFWLLSKNRIEDARKSLQWLRGWVPPEYIENEFKALQRSNDCSNSCKACVKQNIKCTHPPPTIMEKMQELTRKRTLKPFFLVMSLFMLSQLSGILAMRPYTVQILKSYGVPIDANWATVWFGLVGLLANIILLAIIRFVGKRRIYLFALIATFVTCISLSIYGFIHLPSGWTSFDKHENMDAVGTDNYLPLVLFVLLNFFSSLGVIALPWMLLSEVFPFKARGFATGLAAALNYLFAFIATKTYYNLETILSVPGVTLVYGIIGASGFIVMFMILPETESRSLEEIEIHFSDNNRKITDRKILKAASKKKQRKDIDNNVLEKPVYVISDVNEMNKNGSSVADGNGFMQSAKNGCDNKAFSMDR